MVVRLHFTYILGKHCVPRLTVLQLIQAIYLLNKNTAQKNFVRKKSTYLAHFPFSYSYFCLLIDNSSSSSLKKKEKKFPHQIIIEWAMISTNFYALAIKTYKLTKDKNN